jgi:hypothetical protein
MEKPYYYENDLRDFSMPYKIHGKIDYEVMKAKYLRLTNASNRATNQRFIRSSKW